ncbi:restriction endonuclease subunit S [Legionella longbeachae]|uniref:restriction endonuclease subunit S n=1 Tax=Legionella longbeachae TaxID=450 RepID=UPI00177E31BB|nr:restriction endonuclease subunit S [Legionella longbeachae]
MSLSYGNINVRDVENNFGLLPESFNTYQIVDKGDIILRLTDLQNDKKSLRVGFAKQRGIITSAYLKLKSKKNLEPRFAYRLLHSYDTTKVFYGMGGGLRQSMNFEDFRRLPVLIPPIEEQRAIADFLDKQTAKIDTLIEKQKRLIQLLEEKSQAMISHAVTKGLNPNVKMKDSVTEWLGEVPEHWNIKKIKYIKSKLPNSFVDGPFGSNLKSEHFVESGDVYVIESNFATQGKLTPSDLKTITKDHFSTIQRSEAKEGDIIIAKIGAQYGKASILPRVDKKAVVSGNSLKLSLDNKIVDTQYVLFALHHLKNEGAMDDIVNTTAQPALSLGGMNNLSLPIPNIDEQISIVTKLKYKICKLQELIKATNCMIRLSQERRTALISAAVTGKIDVRNIT